LHIWSISSGLITDTIGDQLELAHVMSITMSIATSRTYLVTFEDGNIGIVDIVRRCYLQKLNASHVTPIASCFYIPANPNTLATVGKDGRICLWTIPTLTRNGGFRMCQECITASCISPFSPGGG
jgi:WD40 repeat protein